MPHTRRWLPKAYSPERMTTIIGMICDNGVVLGADSASTLPPRSEVEEHTYEITKQKIWISETGIWRVMSATTGQAASGDWMKLAVEEYFRKNSDHSLGIIQHTKGVREHMLNELNNLGHAPRRSDSILLVFAGPGASPNQILKFSRADSKPEYFDYRKPFVAVGSICGTGRQSKSNSQVLEGRQQTGILRLQEAVCCSRKRKTYGGAVSRVPARCVLEGEATHCRRRAGVCGVGLDAHRVNSGISQRSANKPGFNHRCRVSGPGSGRGGRRKVQPTNAKHEVGDAGSGGQLPCGRHSG